MNSVIKFLNAKSISSVIESNTRLLNKNRNNLTGGNKKRGSLVFYIFMSNVFRKILLLISSQLGIHTLALLILGGALAVTGSFGWHFLEMALGIIIIRLLYDLMARPKPILATYLIRKKTLRVAEDEIKVSLALAALAFILNWPIDAMPILIFIPANMVAQIMLMKGSKILLKILIGHGVVILTILRNRSLEVTSSPMSFASSWDMQAGRSISLTGRWRRMHGWWAILHRA